MKTALITGSAKGIGREIARQLGSRGFHVFIGARNAEAGRAATDALVEDGVKATFIQIDISDAPSIAAALLEFSKLASSLDVLVNNAAIIDKDDREILTLDADVVAKTMVTNTLGALRVTQTFTPMLSKSDAPRVVNISSGGGQLDGGAEGWAPAYCISKTALNGVTSQLAFALPTFAVNSVCPGWVRTDMGGASAPRSVEQGADTVVWLATEAPQEITGQFLRDRQPIPW